jgi:hypothetical protein
MATGTLVVEAYPLDGATALEVEESTVYGWIQILDESSIGTFPAYTLSYQVATTTQSKALRYRWMVGTKATAWRSPLSLSVATTAQITARLTQAVLAKAVRILLLVEAPMGSFGELSEFGMAMVRPDYQQTELLKGLRYINWEEDLTALVTSEDVIRAGLQADPSDFPEARMGDVDRAIDAAVSWVASEVLDGMGIA